jgi:hypothetical protein
MAVTKNEAGFRGRQWESSLTGQQYATRREAVAAESEILDHEAERSRLTGEIMATGVPFITAMVMASDQLSARRARERMADGTWTPEQAVTLTGSYARLGLAWELWREGHLTDQWVLSNLPDLWRGSDPDDTDERWPYLWRLAYRANGRHYVRDGRPLPRGKLLRVYRGQREGDPFGIAWTTDPKVAGKFARSLGGRDPGDHGGVTYTGLVPREAVLAYITRRGESEVVVDPEHVRTKAVLR